MIRVAIAVLAVVGLLLASAGLLIALAVGPPALGFNPYGRNPLDFTFRGLASAATLYAVGAALLAGATRWLRAHTGPLNVGAFAIAGAAIPAAAVWLALRGYWTTVPLLLLFVAGILVPIALGGRAWGKQLSPRARA
jgi:hypothetical protein